MNSPFRSKYTQTSGCSSRVLRHLVLMLGLLCSTFSYAGEKKGDEKSYEGILKTGIMAIGVETTGVVLVTEKDGKYELDFGKKEELRISAEKLDGKQVLVFGQYKPRKGVEVRERRIIAVQRLQENKAASPAR